MKVLCYGDSNTYGYDPRSFFGDRYSPEVRWVDLLGAETGWETVNAGQNGREIPKKEHELCCACEEICAKATDLVIIMLGTNDLLNGADAVTTAERMERFLQTLLLLDQRLLLVAPPPMREGEWTGEAGLLQESASLAYRFRSLATRLDILFVDSGEWGIELCFDGVHFSENGSRQFATFLSKALSNMGMC